MQLSVPHLVKTCSYINGQWLESDRLFEVENPANQQVISHVCEVTSAQVELAIDSASNALIKWQKLPLNDRVKKLKVWNQLILKHKDDLAKLMTCEQGKTLKEAKGEVDYGASYIEWYAEEAKRVCGSILTNIDQSRRSLILKRPVGVVSAVTPWNFPSAMILRKASAALAAGNTFVVKPSELTPLSALALAELADQAEIPAGVFNVVVGSNPEPIGRQLTGHTKVSKFSFTGSTAVGKKLLSQCALGVKKAAMELGGNAPFIVFDDADIVQVLKCAMGTKFKNAGQVCVAANRFLVQSTIYNQFIEQLTKKMTEIKMGSGEDENTNMGPLINRKAVEKVEGLVNQAKSDGAKISLGGNAIEGEGYFFKPTLITQVKPNMAIFDQEIFGPIVSVIPFDDEKQAIQLANQTNYGLSAYAFTQNMHRTWRLSEQLNFGMVGINEGAISSVAAPFGGTKESGMGREGGRWGIEEYLETRYVCMGNIDLEG